MEPRYERITLIVRTAGHLVPSSTLTPTYDSKEAKKQYFAAQHHGLDPSFHPADPAQSAIRRPGHVSYMTCYRLRLGLGSLAVAPPIFPHSSLGLAFNHPVPRPRDNTTNVDLSVGFGSRCGAKTCDATATANNGLNSRLKRKLTVIYPGASQAMMELDPLDPPVANQKKQRLKTPLQG